MRANFNLYLKGVKVNVSLGKTKTIESCKEMLP